MGAPTETEVRFDDEGDLPNRRESTALRETPSQQEEAQTPEEKERNDESAKVNLKGKSKSGRCYI